MKADGGYIVVAPSLHISGNHYAWDPETKNAGVAPLPGWLLEMLKEPAHRGNGASNGSDGEPIPEGQRNEILTSLAGTMRRRRMTEEEICVALLAVNKRCVPPLPEDEVRKIAASVARYASSSEGAFDGFSGSSPLGAGEKDVLWPEPGELPGGLLPVPAMSEVLIPEPFRPWLTDIAERMQCPLEFPTVGALVSLAGLVGRRIGIRPKKHDDWLVIPNLWGAVIGRPGILKSPALAEVMKPLYRLEMEARKQYENALRDFEAAEMVVAMQKEAIEKEIKDALKQGKDRDTVVASIKARLAEYEAALKPPVLVRYIVNDPTVEKLGELLK